MKAGKSNLAEIRDFEASVEIPSELELLRIALTLADGVPLSSSEHEVSRRIDGPAHPSATGIVAAAIRSGGDPLGDAFTALRTREHRRDQGQTLSPPAVIASMLQWGAELGPRPERVIDAGAGTGRYTIAAASHFPNARIMAVEKDPVLAILLRANLAVLGLTDRVDISVSDYRTFELGLVSGRNLFIGNPPYVRHHLLTAESKEWLRKTTSYFGARASQLAGLHLHFFVRSLEIARPDDALCFITAAEWLDVNYGESLKEVLLTRMGLRALHLVDATLPVFSDAMTTSVITACVLGSPSSSVALSHGGVPGSLAEGLHVSASTLDSAEKWTPIIRRRPRPRSSGPCVGDLFRVKRGQVTGANAVWVASPSSPAAQLPAAMLRPAVTRAQELFEAGEALCSAGPLKRVVDIPANLDHLAESEREAVAAFLEWAQSKAADASYIARHRKPWYAVRLYDPAPILCTYMARRLPTFVRNICAARHLNICHGLYPRASLSDKTLDLVAKHLRATVNADAGRTYSGGLLKFEPREVERLPLPPIETILEA